MRTDEAEGVGGEVTGGRNGEKIEKKRKVEIKCLGEKRM